MEHVVDKPKVPDQTSTVKAGGEAAVKRPDLNSSLEPELIAKLDKYSLESIVEHKIARFLDQIGSYYPDDLYDLIMSKVEKPLLHQILRRTGHNQVHAAKVLGINRNTLRKKMKEFGL